MLGDDFHAFRNLVRDLWAASGDTGLIRDKDGRVVVCTTELFDDLTRRVNEAAEKLSPKHQGRLGLLE